MAVYHFYVDGRSSFSCAAPNNLAAYTQANAFYGSLPQGAWMDGFAPRTYRWAEGNFFD
jgi:hypothetical protein